MSWNLSLIGKPEALAKALEEYVPSGGKESVEEYNLAKPYLVGLIRLNFAMPPYVQQMMKINASGHGAHTPRIRDESIRERTDVPHSDTEHVMNQCLVQMEFLYGTVVS